MEYHLRAPRSSGEKLVHPPAEKAGASIARNASIIQNSAYDLGGCSLACVARHTKAQLVSAAYEYSRQYRDVAHPPERAERVLIAGHQPELFHPGVWLKNFVLGRIAAQHDAVAVNLVIDSDTIKRSTLRVPTGSPGQPFIETVPLDQSSAEIPWEQRRVLDGNLLSTFGDRAARALEPLVPNPILRQFWPRVSERAIATGNLGASLSQARHQLEGQWGLGTLEIPQSRVCQLEGVLKLTAHLLAHLPRLWDVYNEALAEFRRANHIRSSSHPAPDLALQDDWLEAPFWIYRDDDPRRRRLFVRNRNDQLVLTDRRGLEVPLELSAELPLDRAVEQMAQLPARGIHLRTRALITTLTARLLCGDLFLHGIGGGKYDQLTDLLIHRFFAIQPPCYMVVSGTLCLPVTHAMGAEPALRSAEDQLRQLAFHPERFLTPEVAAGDARELVTEKTRWITTPATTANARQRCRAIRGANESLQAFVGQERENVTSRLNKLRHQLQSDAILNSREYAFCLFPEETLRAFLLEFPNPGA